MRAAHDLPESHQQPHNNAQRDKGPRPGRGRSRQKAKNSPITINPLEAWPPGKQRPGPLSAGIALNRGIRDGFAAILHQIPRTAVVAHAFQGSYNERAQTHQKRGRHQPGIASVSPVNQRDDGRGQWPHISPADG